MLVIRWHSFFCPPRKAFGSHPEHPRQKLVEELSCRGNLPGSCLRLHLACVIEADMKSKCGLSERTSKLQTAPSGSMVVQAKVRCLLVLLFSEARARAHSQNVRYTQAHATIPGLAEVESIKVPVYVEGTCAVSEI